MHDEVLKMGPHDVGGEKYLQIDTEDHGMTYWEKFSNGLRIAVSAKKIITLDELRLTAEKFGDEYFQMEYFERNGKALTHACLNKKLLTDKELIAGKKRHKENFTIPMIELPDPKSIIHLHDGEPHTHNRDDFQEDEKGEGPPDYFLEMLTIADILTEKKLIKMEDIFLKIEQFDNQFPARGIDVVTRAWVDNSFRDFLINDAKNAIIDIGIKLESFADIICMPQSDKTHHLVVCTLCSCYPRALLGMPPSWYKSRSYRSRVVYEPRKVLEEFGTIIPDSVEVKVHDSNADMRYLILPQRPKGTEGWSESALSALISRDHLVGVRLPKNVI
ncbi:MAG: nitrile hydratase subunit alpha [Alphaproteobacteria bacterium]|jgi:hypothetical protein|tara:strand:+ start:2347 stop:3339 length:993 start_codon:yes stop_codon:yes gene_type:complete